MPAEFEVVPVVMPVCRLVIVAFTPGTMALELSTTVPLISPVFAF